jgi:hypothetical protein
MIFAIKAAVSGSRARTFVFSAQKTTCGGKGIATGDTIFVFASENEGGDGLIVPPPKRRIAVTMWAAVTCPRRCPVASACHSCCCSSAAPPCAICRQPGGPREAFHDRYPSVRVRSGHRVGAPDSRRAADGVAPFCALSARW